MEIPSWNEAQNEIIGRWIAHFEKVLNSGLHETQVQNWLVFCLVEVLSELAEYEPLDLISEQYLYKSEVPPPEKRLKRLAVSTLR